jgi:hypothetical protein
MTTADKTWTATTPAETDTMAQAYVNGWHHCLDGNDVRFGNPYRIDNPGGKLAYAFYAGALDCMESAPDETPDPVAMSFPDTRP